MGNGKIGACLSEERLHLATVLQTSEPDAVTGCVNEQGARLHAGRRMVAHGFLAGGVVASSWAARLALPIRAIGSRFLR